MRPSAGYAAHLGNFRPLVILPSSASAWPENRLRMVLHHEFAHIVRHDWCLQICAEVARSIYWFHPLVGIAARRLRHESERACDDSVLNSGVEPSEYANLLLDLARTPENSGTQLVCGALHRTADHSRKEIYRYA